MARTKTTPRKRPRQARSKATVDAILEVTARVLVKRGYETHDIWHVVTGFHTDVAGELGLQAFYLAQFPGRWRCCSCRWACSTPRCSPATT
jgi:ubiquinone biosynthesis protein Coq4